MNSEGTLHPNSLSLERVLVGLFMTIGWIAIIYGTTFLTQQFNRETVHRLESSDSAAIVMGIRPSKLPEPAHEFERASDMDVYLFKPRH